MKIDKNPKINQFHLNPIECLGFPEPIMQALKSPNILLVGDLLIHRRREVLRLPKIGKESMKKIEAILAVHKLFLSDGYERGGGRFGYIHPEYGNYKTTVVWPPDISGRKKTFKEIHVDCVIQGIIKYT